MIGAENNIAGGRAGPSILAICLVARTPEVETFTQIIHLT